MPVGKTVLLNRHEIENSFLLGLFIYACRYQWALLGACYSHESAAVQCKEQDAGHKGPAGDHA